MANPKPKPTRLQKMADKKNKVLTGPKGSKPQSTTKARSTKPTPKASIPSTIKAKPAAKPKAQPAGPPAPPASGRQPRAITNGSSNTMRQIRAKAVQANRQTQGKPVQGGTRGRALTPPNSARAGRNLIREGATRARTIGDSGQIRAITAQATRNVAQAQAKRGAKAATQSMSRTLARSRFMRGPASAVVSIAAEKALGPLATKVGAKLAQASVPALRALDRALPGINSKDERRQLKAAAAKTTKINKFSASRATAFKKASAIKGSPVVGPRGAGSSSGAAELRAYGSISHVGMHPCMNTQILTFC